jgi:Flp pilus assembly pilin Flp
VTQSVADHVSVSTNKGVCGHAEEAGGSGVSGLNATRVHSSLDEARVSPFLRARERRSAPRDRDHSLVKRYERIVALRKRQKGQGMAEYAVVLAVITISVFAALALLSGNIVNAITRVAGYIT